MYRTIDTGTWKDPWFSELSRDARLVFLYLITNDRTLPSGLLEITPRILAFESGVDGADLQAALKELTPKVTCWWQHNSIWVHNFYRYQRANSNDKFRLSAARSLANFPPEIRQAVCNAYPELSNNEEMPPQSHSGGIPMGYVSHTNKETVTEAGAESESGDLESEPVLTPPARTHTREATADAPAHEATGRALTVVPARAEARAEFNDFAEQFWETYPPRKGVKREKGRAIKALHEIAPARWDEVLAAARNYARSPDATDDFAKDAFRWLAGNWDAWIDYQPPKQGSSSNGKHNGYQTAGERQSAAAASIYDFLYPPPDDSRMADADLHPGGEAAAGRQQPGRGEIVDARYRSLGTGTR